MVSEKLIAKMSGSPRHIYRTQKASARSVSKCAVEKRESDKKLE